MAKQPQRKGRKRSIEPLQALWIKFDGSDPAGLSADTVEHLYNLCARSMEDFAAWWLDYVSEIPVDRSTYAEVLSVLIMQWRQNRRYVLLNKLKSVRQTISARIARSDGEFSPEEVDRLSDQDNLLIAAIIEINRQLDP